MDAPDHEALDENGLDSLLHALRKRGYLLVGPKVRDGSIVHQDIESVEDLPRGWSDEQEAGRYRLVETGGEMLFDFNVGADSWKKHLHPPTRDLWRAVRRGDDVEVTPEPVSEERFAFIGVRSCDLGAIAIHDRVFLGGPHTDPDYKARRRNCFIVAVNCSKAGATCFCVSMGTGPKAERGFDLALTEIAEDGNHWFIVEVGTEAGREVLDELPRRKATPDDMAAADAVVERTARSMGREMPAEEVPDLLMRNLDHARWDDVADRCLTCGNCTMVCPTCFCTTVEDSSDLTAKETARRQRWDSCFTMDFSYIHGGSVRSSARSRYRQWMTHKLATWHDQFGTSGCVGCGRCIAWCPVGIDITEEVKAILSTETGQSD